MRINSSLVPYIRMENEGHKITSIYIYEARVATAAACSLLQSKMKNRAVCVWCVCVLCVPPHILYEYILYSYGALPICAFASLLRRASHSIHIITYSNIHMYICVTFILKKASIFSVVYLRVCVYFSYIHLF